MLTLQLGQMKAEGSRKEPRIGDWPAADLPPKRFELATAMRAEAQQMLKAELSQKPWRQLGSMHSEQQCPCQMGVGHQLLFFASAARLAALIP